MDPQERYTWWGWVPETDNDNEDDRENVYYLTIGDHGEEFATIVHRTVPDGDGVEKFPLDGRIANKKIKRAKTIVAALNTQARKEATMDAEESKARALVEVLQRSIPGTTLFWDRGPYCARIPLQDPDPANEGSLALFAFVEDSDDYRIQYANTPREQWGWIWHVAIGGEFASEWATDLQDSVSFRFMERTNLGDGTYEVACQATLLHDVLVHGIDKWSVIHDAGVDGASCGTPVQNAFTTGDDRLVTCEACKALR